MNSEPVYARVLLKLSGEALLGERDSGLDMDRIDEVASEIKTATRMGVQVAIVVGGGNIFRGLSEAAQRMDRVVADQMGMLATVINALALKETIEAQGDLKAVVMSAVPMEPLAGRYDRGRALDLLDEGRVLILAAGTGLPYFTTDTAAALRAVEVKAEVLLKATKVDGVFDSDPVKNPAAKFYERLDYQEMLVKNLRVMDQTAVSLCRENDLPVLVFKMAPGNLAAALSGQKVGTIISGGAR
ncbi:MAG: UMP kinase [Deltaproteobacteria bacterium]|nr:UMP kinase [Deltaproteobacteria bacterium]